MIILQRIFCKKVFDFFCVSAYSSTKMILKNQHIIIPGLSRFDDELAFTGYNLAMALAKENFVYYIDNPFTIKDYFRYRKTKKYAIRKQYMKWRSDGLMNTQILNLKVIIVPVLASLHFLPEGIIYRIALKINETIIKKRLKKLLAKKNISDFIFINAFNYYYPGVGKSLKPSLSVYYCLDPLPSEYEKKHGIKSELILVKKSDLVICSSKELYREKIKINPDTFFIPNAADVNHSSKALDPTLPVSGLVLQYKKPVIGYFGNIEGRIDFDLVKKVAEQNPEKSFLFVGPVVRDYVPDWFFHIGNIYLPGAVSYDQMPSVVKGFDVAIIPFKRNNFSKTIFPLKFFEYLGSGKAVVSTDFNTDLFEFTKDTVAYCTDAESFSKAINDALNDSEVKLKARIAIAAENTWEQRANEISGLIADQLDRKKAVINRYVRINK